MELIIEDAVIVTMDEGGAGSATGGGSGAPGEDPPGAMLVRDGRVAVVGSPERVRAAATGGAAVVRLDGATVVPGLIDAHCHVANIGYLATAADCSQPSAPSI